MLTERFSHAFLARHLAPLDSWRPFPNAADRDAWNALRTTPGDAQRCQHLVDIASESLEQPWPSLIASRYMDYVRDGNRSRYEALYFARRKRVGLAALAECIEHDGRFVDEVIDGVWAICDEATWCLPAHAEREPDGPLPRLERPTVDLFAAETAFILAEAYWLVAAEVSAVSREVGRRMRAEILARVIEPVEQRDDWGWFSGFNNWTPWVCASVLGAAMYVVEDTARLASLAYRLLGPLDRFIARYGDDGGCDEGPGYWNHAAGSLLMFLELLHSRTGGAADVFGEAKLKEMGRYVLAMHVHGPWFVNFADSSARSYLLRSVVHRYGERIGDNRLMTMAKLHRQGWDPFSSPSLELCGSKLGIMKPTDVLRELFWLPYGSAENPLAHDSTVWLRDIQVFVARSSEESSDGLFLAAKGGHNGESHNHNDIGQFMIALDGEPRVIDIGVEAYTAKTFGPQRYDIWCIRGTAHNAPVVNGVEQAGGVEYRAANVFFEENGTSRTLQMDVHGAYPEAAGLASLRREFTFVTSEEPAVQVRDTFAMRQGAGVLTVTLFSPKDMRVAANGELRLVGSRRDLVCRYPADTLSATVDTVPLEDRQLANCWGETLWRCVFTLCRPMTAGEYTLRFLAANETARGQQQ
jgi:hypothetical protein